MPINNIDLQTKEDVQASQGVPPQKDKNSSSTSNVDPLILAFLYLAQSALVISDTAITHAKQMQGNAAQQQAVNNAAAKLPWVAIPKEIIDNHTQWNKHKHHHWLIITYYTYTEVQWKTYPNLETVEQAIANSKEEFAFRERFEQQLAMLQQTATTASAKVSTDTQESVQAMQAGGYVLDLFRSVIYAVLLRRPPQIG